MRHYIHLAGLLVVLSTLSSALVVQDAAAQGFTGSLQVGLTAATFSGESSVVFKNKFGWGGGLGIGYDFGNGIIIQPEILYIVKGGNATTDGANLARILGDDPQPGSEDIEVSLSWSLTYLEFPLLVIYRFETESYFHPRLFAGPSVSSKMDANLCYRGGSLDIEFCNTDDSIQEIDYGFVIGGGLEIDVGFERFTIGTRLTVGRSNIRSNDPPIRNRSLYIFTGLVF